MLAQIEYLKKLRKIVKGRWRGVATFLCPDTMVQQSCEQLGGKAWKGFSQASVASPKVREVEATWHPEGHDGSALLTAHYDSWNLSVSFRKPRKPGYARIKITRIAKASTPIVIEPAGKKRIIQGTDTTKANEAAPLNEWRLTEGDATSRDYFIGLVIQTAYYKSKFRLGPIEDLKDCTNKYRMPNIWNAAAGTLLCIGVEANADFDPDEKLIAVNYYLLWNQYGWNNAKSKLGCWVVQRIPVWGKNATTGIWERVATRDVQVFDLNHVIEWHEGTKLYLLKDAKAAEKREPFRVKSYRAIKGLRSW